MKNWGGQFTPKLGGHFELESGAHFKLELGGQYHWNLQSITKLVWAFAISKDKRNRSRSKVFFIINSLKVHIECYKYCFKYKKIYILQQR